jgi:hypothetical protein
LLRYARHGTTYGTEPGRIAAESRFEREVRAANPSLPEHEIRKRARFARKAFYVRLGQQSAAARRAKAGRKEKGAASAVEEVPDPRAAVSV